jgi:PAS domain S-box-containing protein
MRKKVNPITSYLRKQPLTRLILGSMMSIALMLIIVSGHYWASYENRKYKAEYNQIKNDLLEYQKQQVKREVQRTLNYVTYMRSLSRDRMINNLTNRVNTAWDIADNIYQTNKGLKSDDEIKKMIKDALRQYRSGDHDDYVFIYSLDGSSVLLPKNPSFEGRSALAFSDSLGNYMVRREINLMNEVDKGFITYYHKSGSKEGDSSLYRNTYIKKFKPFGWYLGSKEYLADFEKSLKEDVLNRVSKIRFETEGYIFIQDFDNQPLISNGNIYQLNKVPFTAVDISERQRITDLAMKGGGYVDYMIDRNPGQAKQPKIAYIEPINEWGWIIGAGFFLKDVDDIIKLKGQELSRQRMNTIKIIAAALLIILLLGYVLAKLLVNKIKRGFLKFDKFFSDASTNYTAINEDELFSPELVSLGRSANKMLSDLNVTRKALEKEHSLLRSVMNSIPDMVFFKDVESKYMGCNEAFCKYLGITDSELIGKTDFELFPVEAASFYYSNDQKILKNGVPIRNEEWSTLPNGTRCLFDTVKALCHDRMGNILGIICISRDITERETIQKKYIEAKEKAEESDRLKTAFLANMSHEIRTPMNSIVGFSNLIAEGGLTREEQKEYVGHIDTAINNLLNLINDIIDIAKIEAGQLSIKPEYFNLSKLMDDQFISASEYMRKLNKDHIALKYSIGSDLSNVKVLADPFRLNQVLTNLVNNAIKFTQRGEICFGCELRENEIHFFVTDTGIGISGNDQQLLFRRFRQVGETTGHKMGGTGLGLAISKHIIDLMNGEISVQSKQGSGSAFRFFVPFYPLYNEADKKTDISSTIWKNKVILIIEAEDASFNYLKAVFSTTGAKIIRSQSAKEALNIIQDTDRIDLIYTDINPEDNNVRQFIKDIRKSAAGTPVIAQVRSGNESVPSVLECDTIVAKPVKYHLLLEVIAPYVKN